MHLSLIGEVVPVESELEPLVYFNLDIFFEDVWNPFLNIHPQRSAKKMATVTAKSIPLLNWYQSLCGSNTRKEQKAQPCY
mmetsp:Transcript_15468/g.28036  ORF Transcript_15468/g.28036 Transcript_15468/m.28036 type:complete len:80 (-) Transcript_15468:965-1204(-)